MQFDPRIDQYIAKSAPFAQPILEYIRTIVHEACPEVKENIKWGFPHFEYRGSILCSMASFKQHCAFGFWLGKMMKDPEGIMNPIGKTAMGQMGKLTSKADLPSKTILIQYIQEAMGLIEQGVKLKAAAPKEPRTVVIPDFIQVALKTNAKAHQAFDNFSYSHRKEYIEWITEAKTEATRQKRIATMLEWLQEGKNKDWKYEKK